MKEIEKVSEDKYMHKTTDLPGRSSDVPDKQTEVLYATVSNKQEKNVGESNTNIIIPDSMIYRLVVLEKVKKKAKIAKVIIRRNMRTPKKLTQFSTIHLHFK